MEGPTRVAKASTGVGPGRTVRAGRRHWRESMISRELMLRCWRPRRRSLHAGVWLNVDARLAVDLPGVRSDPRRLRSTTGSLRC